VSSWPAAPGVIISSKPDQCDRARSEASAAPSGHTAISHGDYAGWPGGGASPQAPTSTAVLLLRPPLPAEALSQNVKPGEPLGVDILGARVVLYRDLETGQVRGGG
jgi:hypothetical protein